MRYAFNDNADGYYEVDVPDGELLPAWTNTLTPCPITTKARSPVWANAEHTAINLVVQFPWQDNESPLTVNAGDEEPNSFMLYIRAIAGDFGAISDYLEPIAVGIPDISPRQIRQALTRLGLRQAVEDAVAAGDQDMKDWWEFSTTFERNHPVVIAMATALGVTDADMDNLWALGLTL